MALTERRQGEDSKNACWYPTTGKDTDTPRREELNRC